MWFYSASQDVAAASKAEEDDLSDKGSESDEAEGNKDSPSERDEESDKQSDTEVDEIAGDDEEVCVISLGQLTADCSHCSAAFHNQRVSSL